MSGLSGNAKIGAPGGVRFVTSSTTAEKYLAASASYRTWARSEAIAVVRSAGEYELPNINGWPGQTHAALKPSTTSPHTTIGACVRGNSNANTMADDAITNGAT